MVFVIIVVLVTVVGAYSVVGRELKRGKTEDFWCCMLVSFDGT